ncbi:MULTISPECIES: TAXI family TRAP transporter solute-binding subunit [unclassified Methylobacterium]|uniref:TAXI family TRAP transporter solute-binding subunit n=1 Tax=unclassified Methylobacterium TaxID=2615210 RepID=UPI0006F88839|nr:MULTISPECIES: TAXI family TRAP transporter solute-binding subunit [unclassified Methylobacterium]KQP82784.1 C4-dicarboxylate ABC transporter substrate-binding protein [Methylobacterium sp. Leaf117]KQP93276.1 C4-dicarboxylate ABC transporter substrate-binding protein [Methylobacterium sp. Leaf113]MCK2054780.1 C4-dicarboxylate ABC transporter substrate-binding protein [Methylobacterium sp. 37f]
MPAIVVRREWLLVLLALGFALVAGMLVYLSRPTTLTVAVGPRDGAEATLLQTYAQALARGREDVRLKLDFYDDVRDSAEALQRNKADLAVVRPDVLLPENGLTLAILHDEALLIAAPEAAGLENFPDLARKRLGVVERHAADLPFLTNLLAFYDFVSQPAAETVPEGSVGPARVALVPLTPQEVTSAIAEGRVDAVAVIAAPASKAAITTVRAVEAASVDKKINFVSVPDGEAIIQRMPELQSVTIPAGTFGGRPKRPDEDVKTVGASYRLMARGGVSRFTVASVTQHLFEWRSKLAPRAPIANLMKAPDFDSTVAATSARLPNHPGAVDYFEREQQTVFERYEDYIYLLAFFGGTVGSGVAWLAQRLARKRRERIDVVLDRLLDILREVRASTCKADLDGLVRETDDLVADVVQHARERNIDNRTVSALILAIDAVHAAINDERRTLGDAGPETGRAVDHARTARLLSLHTPAAE